MSNALVIIPTYNEIENMSKMLDTIMNLNEGFDVLIVDDGSPDGTAQVVREKMDAYSGYIHLEERTGKLGLGTAYIHGFKWLWLGVTSIFLRWTVISLIIQTTWRD